MSEGNDRLAVFSRAEQMLAEIKTIDDAKQIMNLAEAARVYAKEVGAGLQLQNKACEIKLKSQRKAGEIIEKMDKAKGTDYGGRTKLDGSRLEPSNPPPTYEQLGIHKGDAHMWRTIYKMPIDAFQAYIEEVKYEEDELSTAGLYREARFALGIDRRKDKKAPLHSNPAIAEFYAKQQIYREALSTLFTKLSNNPPPFSDVNEVIEQIGATQEGEDKYRNMFRSLGGR